jgi:hypothetical protein
MHTAATTTNERPNKHSLFTILVNARYTHTPQTPPRLFCQHRRHQRAHRSRLPPVLVVVDATGDARPPAAAAAVFVVVLFARIIQFTGAVTPSS